MTLTTAMIVSSLLGNLAIGASVAAFIPLVVTNAVRRVSGTGMLFIAAWIVADILNVAGLVVLGSQLTQKLLAGWYLAVDSVMFVQLLMFGHSDWGARDPKPAKAFSRRKQRTGCWKRFSELFFDFSIWDSTKVAIICVLGALTLWGVILVYSLKIDPDYETDIPTTISPLALGLGYGASAIFALARVPEFVSGWKHSNAGDKPTHSLSDAMFYLLTLENVFNVLSIFTLSQNPDYLWKAQLPWIIGGIVPIFFDCALLVSIFLWKQRWSRSPKKAAVEAEEKHREEVLEKLHAEELEMKEEWEAEDLRKDAFAGPDPTLKGKKAKKDIKHKQKLQHDYNKRETTLKPLHDRAEERARQQAHLDHLRHQAAASSSSDEEGEAESHIALPPSNRRHSQQPQDQLSRRSTQRSYHTAADTLSSRPASRVSHRTV